MSLPLSPLVSSKCSSRNIFKLRFKLRASNGVYSWLDPPLESFGRKYPEWSKGGPKTRFFGLPAWDRCFFEERLRAFCLGLRSNSIECPGRQDLGTVSLDLGELVFESVPRGTL